MGQPRDSKPHVAGTLFPKIALTPSVAYTDSMARDPKVYARIHPEDFQQTQDALNSLVGMVAGQIEAGRVKSLAICMVGSTEPTAVAYHGSRFLVRREHVLAMRDLCDEMLNQLSLQYEIDLHSEAHSS